MSTHAQTSLEDSRHAPLESDYLGLSYTSRLVETHVYWAIRGGSVCFGDSIWYDTRLDLVEDVWI
jgi:hypothetical protein